MEELLWSEIYIFYLFLEKYIGTSLDLNLC